ncbi:type 1 glutamine amidotransferase [Brevibacillus sp. SYP-B805]|uniref:type 1 glutamine amidotransferase domain-containing protein n=1 Tax=Brevibacillus sp. SYP-B805 TaxID=1578199 RepID=UPI0013ED00DB|nr:type 1 glutamine amidotransferase domain-containing protein [Brevibacillus sp. SYP-B805]NGQ96900.1 type 1 glutamine amidotransferase [Brevibacillus sp. SYP-B805]
MRLQGKRVLCFVEHEFEDLELWYPVLRLREEGATVELAGPEARTKYIGKYGVPCETDKSLDEIRPQDYDGVLVPGGWAPDKLRRYPQVLSFIQAMDQAKKPIGHICHAGWVLISARILQGVKTTSTPGIKDDMENAGAIWVDEEVVVDGHIVGSRRPPDLPAYAKAFADLLAQ